MQKKFLFLISNLVLAASLAHALPPKEAPKAPKGITETLYRDSSFSQKREIRNIQYQFHQDLRKQTEKYRNNNDKLRLEKDLLLLDLEEAKIQKDQTKIQNLYQSIAKKEAQIQQNKHEERNVRYNLESKMNAAINKILGIQ
ncbi:hypothetical protein [Helicobacter canadensis]|uniref:Periplasmic protein n=2 Tax=Helicobacter canadensis TaxID=123841 RepID=C5ZXT3_9HELI|nr:hypothetical protein [Helicobacter canadensis]EES89951.1 hypothetical protein HCAN_1242 [Helicobacter canadensis MIT 98-5491]STP02550.1 Uncharacterised protein [Helicobacter canadensis]